MDAEGEASSSSVSRKRLDPQVAGCLREERRLMRKSQKGQMMVAWTRCR